MFSINYDNTIPEIEAAYDAFWKKYRLKNSVMFTVVYAIFAFVFIDMVITDYTGPIGWVGAGLTLGFLASIWLRPARAKKKIIAAISLLEEEKYSAAFYDDRVEIETVTASEKVDKTVVTFATEEVFACEKADSFMLFVNRSLIYAFPKRCLSEEEMNGLREYFGKI